MYTTNITTAWKDALMAGAIQHISGTLTLINGDTVTLTEANISKPNIRLQATSSSDAFMLGELYTGTMDFTLKDTTFRPDKLRGGTVTFNFWLDGYSSIVVPLGVWNITDPQRGSNNEIVIKCVDNTSKLDVAIPQEDFGQIFIPEAIKKVKELTGLTFEGEVNGDISQVVSNLYTIADKNLSNYFKLEWCSTCRAEIKAIAQYVGGLAYINRFGEIAFRKYADNAVKTTIEASKRFKINLSEYSVRVSQLSCVYHTPKKDVIISTDETTADANTNLSLNIGENLYLSSLTPASAKVELNRMLLNLASVGMWLAGDYDYYGDPTFDLGDMVTLQDGIIPNISASNRYFLITGICWQFRGAQTLISAGAGSTISSAGGSASASASSTSGTITQRANINAVDIDFYRESFTTLAEIGEAMIATSEDTIGIVQITVQIQGTANAENEFRILRDGIMQTTCSCDTTANAQKRTVSLTAVLDFTAGIHIISVEAKGSATILRAIGTVYGQGIQEYTGNPTFDSDYTYLLGELNTYIGSDTMPRIPSQLGGNDVEIIDNGAFEGKSIKYANIPDGTEEVK